MKLSDYSVVQLHDYYHRREDDRFIIGRPESGEYMVVDAAELHAIQLIRQRLSLGHVAEMLRDQQVNVDLHQLMSDLKTKGFVHKVDGRIITPAHEPLHELWLPAAWFGGKTARFVFALVTIFGLFTLAWQGIIPSVYVFFEQPYLSLTYLLVVATGWLLVFVRELAKYGAARSLNIPTRFGIRDRYHLLLPKTFTGRLIEQQQRTILGAGLLALTAGASAALMLAVYVHKSWYVVFAVAIIELLAECLLFLDTDLSRLLGATLRIHKLNERTGASLKEHWKLAWQGKGKPSHPHITTYAFFYMLSMVLAIILVLVYVLPGILLYVSTALARFTPGDAMLADAIMALLLFGGELVLFGMAALRHHPHAHNRLFVNLSILATVVGTCVLALAGVQWFSLSPALWIGLALSAGLGVVCAAIFVEAMKLAYPFVLPRRSVEILLLPVISALLPILIVFTIPTGSGGYLYALFFGGGMMLAAALHVISTR